MPGELGLSATDNNGAPVSGGPKFPNENGSDGQTNGANGHINGTNGHSNSIAAKAVS